MILMDILRFLTAMAVAYLLGKGAAKLGLPAILGWLITGMALGPHALGLISQPLLDAQWYKTVESILECTVGSVSYTHLDVYKRQPQGGAVPAGGGHPGAGA